MNKRSCAAIIAALYLSSCATQEAPKPAPPQPEPTPAAPAPKAAPVLVEAPKPQPKPVVEKARIATQVLFDFDKAVLRTDGTSALGDIVSKSRGVTLESIAITGHADRIGAEAYNLRLSQRRAEAVKAYLVSQGFDAQRLYAEGKGKSQPVTGERCRKMGAENRRNAKLIACLQPDRRVEIEIIGTRTR